MADMKDASSKGDVTDMIKALHEQIDELELENFELSNENRTLKSALWGACTALVIKDGIEVTNEHIDRLYRMMYAVAEEELR